MLLEVKDLCVQFHNDTGITTAVDHISFNLEEGEILGIVGESGSGKSVTSLSVMGLLPSSARYSGQVLYEGADFVTMNFEQLRQFKGDEISMVFQEALTSLNPLIKVGKQCEEMLVLHKNDPDKKGKPIPSKAERKARVLEMFSLVELPEPEVTYNKYPHELSGGQQQRVMIAMALMCSPRLLIADEPTTALDADVQDQIVDLLKTINKTTGTAIMFISHDLGLVRKICHNVLVMYKGKIVERGTIKEIFDNPKEAYTKKLIAAITDEIKDTAPIEGDNILEVRNLSTYYNVDTGKIGQPPYKKYITKNLSFSVKNGEILGLVGSSGSGKSTISKAILKLHKGYTGDIILNEPNPQMIFQDSAACLNPARKIGWILEEPLKNMTALTKEQRKAKVKEILAKVELPEEFLKRYPRQLSGGQKQRVNIALALITGSHFIIADEPVSALDVTIQDQILDLILSLQKELNLSMIFISHDINVINRICDRVIHL